MRPFVIAVKLIFKSGAEGWIFMDWIQAYPSVELFCNYVEGQYARLDVLINNAAQTVRRPPGFYAHLLANESLAFKDLSAEVQTITGVFRSL